MTRFFMRLPVLAFAAATSPMFSLMPQAQAAGGGASSCTMHGTHQECTGDASGEDLTQGDSTVVSSIRIYDLSNTFYAAEGCAVDLYGAGPLGINVNTGAYGLVSAQYGLTATVTTGPGGVTIDNIGSVTSGSEHAAIYGETRGGGAVNITTEGDLGGGYYGIWSRTSNTDGAAGVVNVTTNGGDIAGSTHGIYLRADEAHVTINAGSVHGGDTGIFFEAYSSGSIEIINYGTVSGADYAIATDDGDDSVENFGTVRGNVDLGGGADVFDNLQSGLVETGSTFVAASFINRGTISPGGDGTVQTTAITGNLEQTGTGRYAVDLVETGGSIDADRIDVNGNATLAGTVVVTSSGDLGASGSIVIASVENGDLTNELGEVVSNGRHRYTLSATYGAIDYLLLSWILGPTVTETIAGSGGPASPGQLQMAQHLDQVVDNGTGSMAFDGMVNEIAGMTPGQARQALDRLSPEHYGQRLMDTSQSVQAFMSAVMSCPTLKQQPGFIQEGQCYWAKVGGRHSSWDATNRNAGGDEEAWTTSGGVQVALHDEWRLGFAGSYERANVSTNSGAATETDRGHGAVILKNRWNTVSFAAAAFVGYGWSDTQRQIGVADIGAARSENEAWFAGSQVRLSQLFEQAGGWYVKPMIDLNATRIQTMEFHEHGAGVANLAVEGDGTWVLSASPALEVGGEIEVRGLVLRPFVRAGATFYEDAVYETTASFIAAPGQAFTIASEFDRRYLDVAAGVDVLSLQGVDLKLAYDGRFSQHSDMHAGSIKAALPF